MRFPRWTLVVWVAVALFGVLALSISDSDARLWRRVLGVGDPSPVLDLLLDGSRKLDSRITFTRASDGTHFDSAGILQTASSNVARFDYDPATGTPLGLLIEGARTNVTLQSEALGTTWTNPGANTTITDNAGVAPDGNTTAEDVEHGDDAETVQQTITASDNTVYTLSAFVKQGTTGSHDFVKIAWLDQSAGANGFEVWFNISTGAVGTAQADGTGSYTAGSATITDVGGGWYRLSAAGQIVSGQTDARFEIINTTADAVDTAEATNSVFWWGLDAEVGSFRTSYIATTTGTVVRAADVATMSTSGWYNDGGPGTILIEASFSPLKTILATLLQIDKGAGADRIHFERLNDETVRAHIRASGTTTLEQTSSGKFVDGVAARGILTWGASNDGNSAFKGTADTPDTSVTPPTSLTTLRIGSNHTGVNQPNGSIKQIKYWNVRKPDSFLTSITTANLWPFETMYAANDNEIELANDNAPWLEVVGW